MTQLSDRRARRAASDAPGADPSPRSEASGASPALRVRELVGVVLGGCLLAVVMTWPLVLHLGTRIAQDLGDPIRTAWQVAWEGHALLRQPLDLFGANAFWPQPDSLAFSDSLLGYAPAGLLGAGPVAAVARYDLLFLLAYALAFAGAYLLARELGAGRGGAAVAGAAFAYAPFRLAMDGHLHVLSSGGIPLALFLMARGYRRGRASLVAAGWLVAAWQLSLGFTLGLQLVYLLGALGVVAAIAWLVRGRPALSRALVLATVAGALAVAALGALQAQPYLRVAERYASAARSERIVTLFSPPPRAFLAAPADSRPWGRATERVRDSMAMSEEKTLFPGAAILLLALAGLAASSYTRGVRLALLAAAVVTAVLSLGFSLAGGWLGYRALFELAPGWGAVRTPGRIFTLTSLALALLAGAGAAALIRRAGRTAGALAGRASAANDARTRPRSRLRALPGAASAATAGLLLAAVLVDGSGRLPLVRVPQAPSDRLAQPDPQLHAPSDNNHDRLYMLWSTDGFPRIVNGTSTFSRRQLLVGRRELRTFPDARSVAALRRLGVRTVVVHLDVAGVPFPPTVREPVPATPTARNARRSIAGLPVRRERLGGALVFHLEPLPSRLASPDR